MSATEQNSSKTTLNPAVETLETLEAIDMAGSFLLEATAHLLLRHYMKQEGEDYQHLSSGCQVPSLGAGIHRRGSECGRGPR